MSMSFVFPNIYELCKEAARRISEEVERRSKSAAVQSVFEYLDEHCEFCINPVSMDDPEKIGLYMSDLVVPMFLTEGSLELDYAVHRLAVYDPNRRLITMSMVGPMSELEFVLLWFYTGYHAKYRDEQNKAERTLNAWEMILHVLEVCGNDAFKKAVHDEQFWISSNVGVTIPNPRNEILFCQSRIGNSNLDAAFSQLPFWAIAQARLFYLSLCANMGYWTGGTHRYPPRAVLNRLLASGIAEKV